MRLYRSDAGWQEREKDIRADAVIVSMSPTKLSLGMVEPAAVSPGKIIVPRIVIGGVILDQPADCKMARAPDKSLALIGNASGQTFGWSRDLNPRRFRGGD